MFRQRPNTSPDSNENKDGESRLRLGRVGIGRGLLAA